MRVHPGILFFGLCLPARAALAFGVSQLQPQQLRLAGWLLLFIGISFAALFFTGSRMRAVEGGGVTWWAEFRLIHAALFVAAGAYALRGERLAWLPLAIDAAVGLFVWAAARPPL